MPHSCEELKLRLVELLAEGRVGTAAGRLREEVSGCPGCSLALRELVQTWESLPDAAPLRPAAALRWRILAYARDVLSEAQPVTGELRQIFRSTLVPALLGTTAAAGFILLATWRGAFAPVSPILLAVLSLLLAGVLTAVSQGLFGAGVSTGSRKTLWSSAGAFGGYALLTLVLPISKTVDVCSALVFGSVHLSLGHFCLVYLTVTAWYAGIPMAVVGYLSARPKRRTHDAYLGAVVFAVMATPVLLLQSGFEVWLVPLTALLGFAGGALLGSVAGRWTGRWLLAPSRV